MRLPGNQSVLTPQERIFQMQYLFSVIDDQASLATPDGLAALDVFNDRLQNDGHWVFAGGLALPATSPTATSAKRDRHETAHRCRGSSINPRIDVVDQTPAQCPHKQCHVPCGHCAPPSGALLAHQDRYWPVAEGTP